MPPKAAPGWANDMHENKGLKRVDVDPIKYDAIQGAAGESVASISCVN
ncbi:hypothetical protein MesoLj113c_42530 [Mesorhizobium sp. 113-3-9]|nr:hypothetical protein MesoLj113c_42530 [Mesorhizobium sp. 113-3-9]